MRRSTSPTRSRARLLRAVVTTIRSTASVPGHPDANDQSSTARRGTAAVAGIASALALLAAGSSVDASAPVDDSAPVAERGVAHELIGTVTAPGAINLTPDQPLRIADPDDQWMLPQWLSEGTDGVLATEVMDLVDEHVADLLPADTVMLVGLVHTGCLPPVEIIVASDASGRVRLGGVPDPQEAATLCEIVEPTIAVVTVSAEDAPVGSTDAADLVLFQRVEYGTIPDVTAVELTDLDPAATAAALATIVPANDPATDVSALADLPALTDGDRRLAFLRAGCTEDTAELVVTPAFVDATLEVSHGGVDADCARANYFVTIFDVPAAELPSTAVIVGQ